MTRAWRCRGCETSRIPQTTGSDPATSQAGPEAYPERRLLSTPAASCAAVAATPSTSPVTAKVQVLVLFPPGEQAWREVSSDQQCGRPAVTFARVVAKIGYAHLSRSEATGDRCVDHRTRRPDGELAVFQGEAAKTDPPLTRRGFSGQFQFRKLLLELVELTGIEPVTS
jgi:hypothetical protein